MIFTSIHVPTDCDVSMRINKLDTDNQKYAVLSFDSTTIFIKSREKVLEIAQLLEQAAQELENENEPN